MKAFLFLSLFYAYGTWARTIELPITQGEVKILYPCSVLGKLDLEDAERYQVTFYEKNERDLRNQGLILRHREFTDESDVTLKFRAISKVTVDEELYQELKRSSDLTCEADVTFDPINPKVSNTCSLKSSSRDDQVDFLKMLDLDPIFFEDLRSVQVEAQRWKMKLPGLKKKSTVEVWRLKDRCLLEVSSRFSELTESSDIIRLILKTIPEKPSLTQGNKTSWVWDGSSATAPN